MSVQASVYCTINDKISVKFNDFVSAMKKKEIYKNVSFTVLTDEHGSKLTLSSVYLIADGGYLDWECLMSAYPYDSERIKYKFTDWIASVRKDVECFFGILKARFRYFKNPICLHDQKDIDNAFVTACIIHNMILDYDGLNSLWETDVNWKNIDPREDRDVDMPDPPPEVYAPIAHEPHENFRPLFVHDVIPPAQLRDYHEVGGKGDKEYLRGLLACHLSLMYKSGSLRWPKIRRDCVDNRVVNEVPRQIFPGAGDLED